MPTLTYGLLTEKLSALATPQTGLFSLLNFKSQSSTLARQLLQIASQGVATNKLSQHDRLAVLLLIIHQKLSLSTPSEINLTLIESDESMMLSLPEATRYSRGFFSSKNDINNPINDLAQLLLALLQAFADDSKWVEIIFKTYTTSPENAILLAGIQQQVMPLVYVPLHRVDEPLSLVPVVEAARLTTTSLTVPDLLVAPLTITRFPDFTLSYIPADLKLDLNPKRFELAKLNYDYDPLRSFPRISVDSLNAFMQSDATSSPAPAPPTLENMYDWLDDDHVWSLSAKPITQASPELSAIQRYISAIDKIRLLILRGRGFGHQAAAIRIMEQICALGFNGQFEIVTQEGQRTLPDDFNPLSKFKRAIQYHDVLSNRVDYPETLTSVKLTINPGDDAMYFDRHLHLLEDQFEMNSESYLALNLTAREEIDLKWLRLLGGTHYKLGRNSILVDTYHPISIDSVRETPYANFLDALNSMRGDNAPLIQSVYGLYPTNMQVKGYITDPFKVLELIVNSLIALQKKLDGKPVIIFFHTEEFEKKHLQWFARTFRENKLCFSHEMDDISHKIRNIQQGDIVFAQLPRLPKRVFEAILIEHNTLPPIVEGASATALLQSTRDFLHGGASSYSLDIPALEESQLQRFNATLEQQNTHIACCHLLEKGDRSSDAVATLSQFLLASHAGTFKNYFHARKEAYLQTSSFLYEALYALSLADLSDRPTLLMQECDLILTAIGTYLVKHDEMVLDNKQNEALVILPNVILLIQMLTTKIIPLIQASLQDDKVRFVDYLQTIREPCEKIDLARGALFPDRCKINMDDFIATQRSGNRSRP